MASVSRRLALQTLAIGGLAALPASPAQGSLCEPPPPGWVSGPLTGAEALVKTLQAEGAGCVFGIPGAQGNELWDEFKSRGLPYLLVTHEQSAAYAADGYARSTGRPGVVCVVPGPGVTNALSGIGEAKLDSVPMVVIVIEIARGEKYRPFQVHDLPNVELLQPVTKGVFHVQQTAEIADSVRRAFALATAGEPGPVAVVVPYNFLIEVAHFDSAPLAPQAVPFDADAFQAALRYLAHSRNRIGIYAGQGCQNYSPLLRQVAELLQAPVATSVSGKGVLDDCHPLAVGWGYGPQGTVTAERVFQEVDVVLAIGVRYSEVSTAYYSIPASHTIIHVDANRENLGQVVDTAVKVHSDAGVFLEQLLNHRGRLQRPANVTLQQRIKTLKAEDSARHQENYGKQGIDPMQFLLWLRHLLQADAQLFVDVTLSEHLAAEAWHTHHPRTYFNPTNNQAMGWSIPAAIGAQFADPTRQIATVTGDGCFLMTAMEVSTAAREQLPVKFFILDDQAYQYMQVLQEQVYRRTTATELPRLNYRALAQGLGMTYLEILRNPDLKTGITAALQHPGPVLTRIATDYGERPIRWVQATRNRFKQELTPLQMTRFGARIVGRTVAGQPRND